VVDEGRAVRLGSGRQAALLIRLILSAGEVVSRDELVDALWGERPPATAANALQVQVHALRKRLGRERIVTTGPGYRLVVDAAEIDRDRFEQLVARGRVELGTGDAEAAAATFRAALESWRGTALADVAYERFAQAEIARLEELRLVAVEERIEADLALARHDELVPELTALVSAQPARERLYGQLMLALYRSGRQVEALDVYRRARTALQDELGLEPGPELQELQQAILRQDAALRVEPAEVRERRRLPAVQTALVGRRREVEELGALLRGADVRLVVLTGAGGSGKTRLALQVAHEVADAFVDGVHFVDLAQLREPALLLSTIAHALGIEERADEPLAATVQARLRTRRLLLLLDNFEVVEEAAPLLSELLVTAPGLMLLVTSRTPLLLSGEYEYRVAPLPLADAMRLFAARARAVAPGFRRPSEEAGELAELCRRLDCLPLAIELAAARTREYSPAELLVLLPSALELASDGPRDLPARQRTLRATIDWSHRMLVPEEQTLFARLAVFAGGCAAAASEAICGAGRVALASLVARNLLYERRGVDGGPRFLMLATVREFALERLEELGDRDRLRRRFAEYYTAEAETLRRRPNSAETAWPRLEEEHDNLRAAIGWCREAGEVALELRLVAALGRFWYFRGHLREGQVRLDAALQHGEGAPATLRADAFAQAARLALGLGEYDRVKACAEESLALSRSLGDRHRIAEALDLLGNGVRYEGDLEGARSLHERSAAMYRELGDDRGLANTLGNLGYVALIDGDYEQATVLSEESAVLFGRIGSPQSMTLPLVNQALAALLQERHEEALSRYRRSLVLALEADYPVALVYSLEGLAAVFAATRQEERAATLLGAAQAVSEASGALLEPFEREIHERTLSAAADALGEPAFSAAFSTGRQFAPAAAAAYALDDLRIAPAPVPERRSV
jgi:predicted ATPase/DNA-binding SARP family transcriptional activator